MDPQPALSAKTMPHLAPPTKPPHQALAPEPAAGGGAQAPVGVGQQLGDG